MMVTNIIARLSSLGAVLHDPVSSTVEGQRECRVLITCRQFTAEGHGSNWTEAVHDALSWFDDPLPPWPFLDVIDVGGES